MKKLIFLFAFAFISAQAFSQMYIVNATGNLCILNGNWNGLEIETIDQSGNEIIDCIDHAQGYREVNIILNNIINQGYKIIHIQHPNTGSTNSIGLVGGISISPEEQARQNAYPYYTKYYLAIPWTASGLEEISVNSTTLKNLFISPNPATDFVDISIDYNLKGESEVVFISQAGYVYHKESVGSISKNEKYRIDISKIPAGKYLVTIVNRKTYTTPQKLIIL